MSKNNVIVTGALRAPPPKALIVGVQGTPDLGELDAFVRQQRLHDVEAVIVGPDWLYACGSLWTNLGGAESLSRWESACAALAGDVRKRVALGASGPLVVVEWLCESKDGADSLDAAIVLALHLMRPRGDSGLRRTIRIVAHPSWTPLVVAPMMAEMLSVKYDDSEHKGAKIHAAPNPFDA